MCAFRMEKTNDVIKKYMKVNDMFKTHEPEKGLL